MNIYYDDESGLDLIGTIDWSDEAYQFDMTGVWKTKRGEYWIASDSGCSCPSPFEDFHGVEDMDGPYDKKSLKTKLNWMVGENLSGYGPRPEAVLRKEVSDLLDRIK